MPFRRCALVKCNIGRLAARFARLLRYDAIVTLCMRMYTSIYGSMFVSKLSPFLYSARCLAILFPAAGRLYRAKTHFYDKTFKEKEHGKKTSRIRPLYSAWPAHS